MGAFKGDVKTNVDAGGLNNLNLNGLIDARTKANLESYTIDASETSGSTLELGGAIPKGARVVAIGIHVSANQSSLTFKLGDNADDDRFIAAGNTSLQTAGLYIFSGKNYKTGQTDGDTQILLTTGGATMTAGQLEVFILYTID